MKDKQLGKKKSYDVKDKEFDNSTEAQAKRMKEEEKKRKKIGLLSKIKEKFIEVFNTVAIIFSEMMAMLTGIAILVVGYIAIHKLIKAASLIDAVIVIVAAGLILVFANINERVR